MASSKSLIEKLNTRKSLHYGILVLSAFFVMVFFSFASEPDMEPLVSDIRLVNAVKIIDVLSSNGIEAKAVPQEKILWVEARKIHQARAILAEAGIDIGVSLEDNKVTNTLANCETESSHQCQIKQERLVRYAIAGLVMIVLIVTVVRPSINELISGKLSLNESVINDKQMMRRLSNRQLLIAIISIVGAVFVCIGIVRFVHQPDMRPLINDLTKTDAVLVADVLNQNKVRYYADHQSHMLYVDAMNETRARLALARIGIDVDYPSIKETLLSEAELEAKGKQAVSKNELFYTHPVFIKLIRFVLAAIVLLVILLSFIRPILNVLTRDENEK